jgi:hypothetical protein
MFEVIWQEFNHSDRIVTLRKRFKTEEAMLRFVDKLHAKDNFWQILSYAE